MGPPAEILLVSPALDENDRIAAILGSASPALTIERVRLFGRPNRPDRWRRSIGEHEPVELAKVRLVVLENAAASGLEDVAVAGGGKLLEALPGWVASGGHLVVVGGHPSFETYPATKLAAILPVELAAEDKAQDYQKSRRRLLSGPGVGGGSDAGFVRRLHPVVRVRPTGEVLIRAADEPLVVQGRVGSGEVTLVLTGLQEHHVPDAGAAAGDFITSVQWDRLLRDRVGRALDRELEPAPSLDPEELSPPTLRVGATFDPAAWFGPPRKGTLTIRSPFGEAVFFHELPSATPPSLPDGLRPGRYEAVLTEGGRTRRRALEIGTPVDQSGFDIRFFQFGHRPGPLGLAPGEAYTWARELAGIGITSTVYASYVRRPRNNLRTMREILLGGLNLVYYQSFRSKSRYPNRWKSGQPSPPVAKDLSGKAIGWDIHAPEFRDAIDHLFDDLDDVVTLPGIRAIQLIEENKDGARRSPSRRKEMKRLGLDGKEKPGDPGWLTYEDARSRATAETYQRFRALGKRFFPGVPQSSYWPASYWGSPWKYSHRVSALAAAVDEFLGPGYGYDTNKALNGWLSVARSTNEIFNAHEFELGGAKGLTVYAQGIPITPRGGRKLGFESWRETAWTALAGGATGLAYFDLPRGEAVEPLAGLHEELHRLGPYLASAPRRPARVAVLASWSTRTGGSREETKRHHSCIVQLHDTLIYAVEQLDFVREEQLESLPASFGAIALTAAPILPNATLDALASFVQGGGHLFVDADSGTRRDDGSTRKDPWRTLRATGRIHEVAAAEQCGLAGRFEISRKLLGRRWRERLAGIGIEPSSATPDPWTEARLLGEGDLRYWVFLNHHPDSRTLSAHARVEGAGWLWRNLRSGKRVQPTAEPGGMQAEVSVGATDAALWAGTRRPTATLEIASRAEWHRVVVEVIARDAKGRPAPDATPLHLVVRGADGEPRLSAPFRSRGTRAGRASWQLPIRAEERGGAWSLVVEAPLAGVSQHATVEVAAPAGLADFARGASGR